MANNWGKIYESTAWGSGVTDNNISWGKSYADLAGGGGFTGLLDTYSGAAAAYSLRQLSSTYSGNAIKVRRASDNAEQDIAFSNNELDTATLETFASGTDAFVTTWYDQSGNGNDAGTNTASLQFKIVSSGSTILDNGKPSMIGASTNGGNFISPLAYSGSSDLSLFSVLNNNTNNNWYITLDSNSNSPDGVVMWSSVGGFGAYRGVVSTAGYHIGQKLASNIYNSSEFNNYMNSSLNKTDSQSAITAAFNFTYFNIFQRADGAIKMQELIVYTSDEATNRTGIETNINDFYSIY
jgi:hypothetical protein